MSYFERRLPIAFIFGSFFLLLIPMALLSLVPNFVELVPYLTLAVVVGLGGTHFFITLLLYLQTSNLDYFASSVRNRIVYFGVPAFILLGMASYAAFGLDRLFPIFSLYFFAGLRVFDFVHVGRQSFGMLQIFKRPTANDLPPWSRRTENTFFLAMALMQWETYLLGGRFRPDDLYVFIPAMFCGGLFVVNAIPYLKRMRKSDDLRSAALPLVYFAMQAFAAALAIYDTRLYVVGLILHYIEYHVIMAPRCFSTPLGNTRPLDRIWNRLRAYPLFVYAALLLIATLSWFNYLASPSARTTTFFIHIFDGIFLTHYFVEAFLWKFNVPFYRDSLAPLYFAAKQAKKESATRSHRARRRWAQLGVLAITIAGLASGWMIGWLDAPFANWKHRVIEPMHVQNHENWGQALAKQDQLATAEAHLREALRLDPNRPTTRMLLQNVETEIRSKRVDPAAPGRIEPDR